MQNWFKSLIGITFSIFVIVIVAGIIINYFVKTSVPNYNSEYKLDGLKNEIVIYRDSMAIPYINAQNEQDALFALGFLHAQERMFQMDIARRAAEGKLSEIFGKETLLFDKMFLTVGIRRIAERNYKQVSQLTKNNLAAYSKGVNAFLNSGDALPIEFDILNYTPEQWKPEHTLMIIRMMAWELNIGLWTDITFSRIVQKFGLQKAKEILPDYPENAPTIVPSSITKSKNISNNIVEIDKEFRKFLGFSGTHIGSNNWVVNSRLSSSGKPIIANDPHLAYQAPGKWYAVVVNSKNLKVAGVSLPGVPGVVIGKNENISWVLTNVMADEADFYAEKVDFKKNKYFFMNDWHDLKIIKELIKIKDAENQSFEIFETHRGPLISEIHPLKKLYSDNKHFDQPISMRWIGADFSDEYLSFFSINKSKNWNDFKNAISHFSVPGQNFVYADKSGNIGYICGAKIPIRPTNSTTFVFDGTNSDNDWKGFVSYTQMPMLFNPSENYIASANNKTVKSFSYHISNLWEPSSRIERIHQLMDSKPLHSSEDFKKYQTDLVSPYAREMTKFIVEAFNGVKITDKNLEKAISLMNEWDFSFDAYLQAPAIYAHFLRSLIKNIFQDELGHELMSEYSFVANVPYRAVMKILTENSSTFIDNKKTQKIERRNEIIRQSFIDALLQLENNYGKDLSKWQWGKMHTVTFKHFFAGKNGLVDKLINIGPYGIGGDGTTIFNTEYSLIDYNGKEKSFKKKPFSNVLGPSMRFIYDFSNPDEFYLISTTGQSGNIFSEHFKDQTEMWISGKYLKVRTDEESFTKNQKITKLLPLN